MERDEGSYVGGRGMEYTVVTGVRFHALFDGETLSKRVEMLSHEGPRKCCQNFGPTFGAEK